MSGRVLRRTTTCVGRSRWALLVAGCILIAKAPSWLLFVGFAQPRERHAARTATGPRLEREWFDLQGTDVAFGAASNISVPLGGPADLANLWLFGTDDGDDSVERLIITARPAGAEVERLPETTASASDGNSARGQTRRYRLEMPPLNLLGLGTARSSMVVWGAIRPPTAVGGRTQLAIGSDGKPSAALY